MGEVPGACCLRRYPFWEWPCTCTNLKGRVSLHFVPRCLTLFTLVLELWLFGLLQLFPKRTGSAPPSLKKRNYMVSSWQTLASYSPNYFLWSPRQPDRLISQPPLQFAAAWWLELQLTECEWKGIRHFHFWPQKSKRGAWSAFYAWGSPHAPFHSFSQR